MPTDPALSQQGTPPDAVAPGPRGADPDTAPPAPVPAGTAYDEKAGVVRNDTTPATDPAVWAGLACGGLLVALGVGGYLLSDSDTPGTALIPAAFGVILLVCAFVAMNGERALKIAMHVAAVVGLLGLLAGLGRLGMVLAKDGDGPSTLGLVSLIGLATLSAVFLALCVKSFVDARRRRKTLG